MMDLLSYAAFVQSIQQGLRDDFGDVVITELYRAHEKDHMTTVFKVVDEDVEIVVSLFDILGARPEVSIRHHRESDAIKDRDYDAIIRHYIQETYDVFIHTLD